jgi:hypothetical protein
VRPEAISSNTFFNKGLVAYCTVDDYSVVSLQPAANSHHLKTGYNTLISALV